MKLKVNEIYVISNSEIGHNGPADEPHLVVVTNNGMFSYRYANISGSIGLEMFRLSEEEIQKFNH